MDATVAVCVVTFRRPLGLRATLDGLVQQELDPHQLDLQIVVVDNDPAQSAQEVVHAVSANSVVPISYVLEEQQGIPYARNRALACADDVDLIAWVDDDEVPDALWLATLLTVMDQTHAAVVIGPSVPALPQRTPSWIRDGHFFERRRFETGSVIPANYARTSGVVIRREAMPRRSEPFLHELRFTGGSDREHFMTMEQSGAVFVWADDAVVTEIVPESRARASWILKRAFRTGNSRSITTFLEPTALRQRLKWMCSGCGKVAVGLVRSVAALPRGRAAAMQGLWQACYGAGQAWGAAGLRFEEYQRHHGS